MEEIIIFPYVEETLILLVENLYKNEYFGFKESAKDYVDTIVAFMFTIPTLKYKRTLNPKHGTYYCTYKHNSKTSWYICFDVEDNLYNIKNITNNHSADYPRFIRGIK